MKLKSIIYSLTLLAIATGCSTSRDHVYLQDMNPGNAYPINLRPEATVQPDDRIDIRISCKIPELALPFNLSADRATQGYTVNAHGDISLPIIGSIHVSGLTLDQVQKAIADRLIAGDYIKDPIVSAKFLNFHYTVLGAVSTPSQYTVDGDRITILEAIARAGDLSPEAITDRVSVIREEPDGRKIYVHDIRSSEIFNSPCYYLRQNDVIYVEPKTKSDKNENRAWQLATLGISAASVVCTIIWATK